MEHLAWLQQQDPTIAQRLKDIENYTQAYIAANPGETRTVVTIPVVVHVLYNTTAQNISDAQVQAQINQLNADFARTNSDAGNTPSVWQSIASNCEVQFCLAQRDPSGNATNGIIHKSTTKTSFTDAGDPAKHNSTGGDDAWPAASYLNLWSCNLGGGLLGYAQFPGGPAATDGVVVLYSSMGSIAQPGTATPYNLGRTATHEVGHWLNLYHIWGDDGTSCSGSDNVTDTPNQSSENYGCVSFPHTDGCSSGNGVMFMNYMDYTDDGCMNMFTAGQKTRMQALFAAGGTRVSLATSTGCTPPSATCGTPSGLSSSSITSSSATVSWSSVSGATSYNVQYKPSTISTWTTTTSTTTSKSLTGLSASTTYNYQVQAVCASGSSAYSAASSFTTPGSGGITYCASNGISQIYEYIDLVSLGTISRSSGADAGGYYNGTASSTNVTQGANYTITTSAGFSGSTYPEQWAVFCDWNKDGDFTDAGETEASFASSGSGNNTATISVPSTATVGSTRMRVSMKYGAAPTSCESFAEGEVEDYSLNVQTGGGGGGCAETGEPGNNSSATPSVAAVGSNILSQISSTTDKDWWSFSNTTVNKNIKITLTTLPGDYDIKLYNPAGTNVKTSELGGTSSETIIYNTTTVGTYKIQVYGYNGAFSTTQCYTMLVQIGASPFRLEAGTPAVPFEKTALSIFPNPATDNMTVQFMSSVKGDAQLNVYNLLGQRMLSMSVLALEGQNTFNLDVNPFDKGSYILEVVNGSQPMRKEFIVMR
jgi:hypothetical protein